MEENKINEPLMQDGVSSQNPRKTNDDEVKNKVSFRKRISLLLSKGSDETQKKAGRNIALFFAGMLLLTLIARGTAGATMPVVQTQTASKGEIVQAVTGTGNVSVRSSKGMFLPEGLVISQVMVAPGQKVKAGEGLLRFEVDAVQEQLSKAKADLKEKQARYKTLTTNDPYDGTSLANAKNSLAWAQQDYDATVKNRDDNNAAAQTALNNANVALTNANNALAALPSTATPEEREAAEQEVENAKQVVVQAQENIPATKAQGDASVVEAARALENAKSGLQSAQISDTTARQSNANTAAENSASAATLALEIQEKEKQIAELQNLADNNGVLNAAEDAVVLDAAAEGSSVTTAAVINMADAAGGYELELSVDKAEAEKLLAGGEALVTTSGGSMYYTPTVTATIQSISEPDENGKSKVKIVLPDGDWKQGQSVQAQMVQSKQTYQMTLPLSALHNDNSGSYVYVLIKSDNVLGSENVIAKLPVTVQGKDANNVAIEAALSTSDEVVVSSSKAIAEGNKVRKG
ncbi:MAG: hypothetical protein ACK5JF_05235 [Oscillospiraceae bacterium]